MKFSEYIDNYGVSPSRFSKLLGVASSTVWAWQKGKAIPHSYLRKRIEELTDGRVKMADWEDQKIEDKINEL